MGPTDGRTVRRKVLGRDGLTTKTDTCPQEAVPYQIPPHPLLWTPQKEEGAGGAMHDAACELPRILFPRTPVNKGKMRG